MDFKAMFPSLLCQLLEAKLGPVLGLGGWIVCLLGLR